MTAKTRAANKSEFEQGDKPQGSNYVDLIDSYVSIADTTAQSISSPLSVTGALGVSTTVSAVSIEASAGVFTTVSANTIHAGEAIFTGTVSASSGYFYDLTIQGNEVLPAGAGAAIEIFVTATAIVTCSATTAFTRLGTNTSAAATFLVEFEHSAANGAARYVGPNQKNIHFIVSFSGKPAAGSNQDFEFGLLKNNVIDEKTIIARRFANTSDTGSMAITGLISMVSGDTVSLGVKNRTAANNFDMIKFVMVGMQT